jgi:RNA polymerase sigma-70 factor (ECF subfamily)
LVHNNYKEKETSLEKKIESKDAVNIVHELVEQLPEIQKIILQLRDVEHYEFDEICAIVEMKPTAVRVALSRARKTVRNALIKKQNYGIN